MTLGVAISVLRLLFLFKKTSPMQLKRHAVASRLWSTTGNTLATQLKRHTVASSPWSATGNTLATQLKRHTVVSRLWSATGKRLLSKLCSGSKLCNATGRYGLGREPQCDQQPVERHWEGNGKRAMPRQESVQRHCPMWFQNGTWTQ